MRGRPIWSCTPYASISAMHDWIIQAVYVLRITWVEIY